MCYIPHYVHATQYIHATHYMHATHYIHSVLYVYSVLHEYIVGVTTLTLSLIMNWVTRTRTIAQTSNAIVCELGYPCTHDCANVI